VLYSQLGFFFFFFSFLFSFKRTVERVVALNFKFSSTFFCDFDLSSFLRKTDKKNCEKKPRHHPTPDGTKFCPYYHKTLMVVWSSGANQDTHDGDLVSASHEQASRSLGGQTLECSSLEPQCLPFRGEPCAPLSHYQ